MQLGDPAAAGTDAGAGPTHQLAVEVTPSPTLATTLLLRDGQGQVLGISTAAAGQRHGFPNLATGARGNFGVTVRRAGKAGAKPEDGGYVLVLRSSPLGPGDEREPNEEAASATPIGATHTEPQVAGYLGTRGDQDVFRIPIGEVADGSVVHLDLDTPPEVVASLAVVDNLGKRLALVKGRKGERLGLRNLEPLRLLGGVGAPAADAYFLAVVRAEGPGDLTRRYVLGVRSEVAADREREPNDELIRATPLVREVSGHLLPADVDNYRLETQSGPAVLELQPPPRLDLSLETATPGGAWTRVERAGRGQPERAPVAAGAVTLVRVVGKRPTDGDLGRPLSPDRGAGHGRSGRCRDAASVNQAAVARLGVVAPLALLALLGCARHAAGPADAVVAYGRALERGDLRAAYAASCRRATAAGCRSIAFAREMGGAGAAREGGRVVRLAGERGRSRAEVPLGARGAGGAGPGWRQLAAGFAAASPLAAGHAPRGPARVRPGPGRRALRPAGRPGAGPLPRGRVRRPPAQLLAVPAAGAPPHPDCRDFDWRWIDPSSKMGTTRTWSRSQRVSRQARFVW